MLFYFICSAPLNFLPSFRPSSHGQPATAACLFASLPAFIATHCVESKLPDSVTRWMGRWAAVRTQRRQCQLQEAAGMELATYVPCLRVHVHLCVCECASVFECQNNSSKIAFIHPSALFCLLHVHITMCVCVVAPASFHAPLVRFNTSLYDAHGGSLKRWPHSLYFEHRFDTIQ